MHVDQSLQELQPLKAARKKNSSTHVNMYEIIENTTRFNHSQSHDGFSQVSYSTDVPLQLFPYRSLDTDKQVLVRVRFPTPHDTEHGDQSVQHDHSPDEEEETEQI